MECKFSVGDIIEAKVFTKDNFGTPYNPLTGKYMALFGGKEETIKGLVIDVDNHPTIKELAKPKTKNKDRKVNEYLYDMESLKILGHIKKFDKKEVEALIQNGETYRIFEYDLEGADLRGLKFTSKAVDFSYISLKGADLSDVSFRNINFSKANLEDTNLNGCNFENAILCDASLYGASVNKTNFRGVSFRAANLRKLDLRSAKITKANFTSADLREANLSGLSVTDVNFELAKLKGASLRGINFSRLNPKIGSRIKFSECDLSNCLFSYTKLAHIDFSLSNLENSEFKKADLRECNFRDSNLKNTEFTYSNLSQAILYRTNLDNTQFNDVDFFAASIGEVDFSKAIMRGNTSLPLTYGNLYKIRLSKEQVAKVIGPLMNVECDSEEFTELQNAINNFINPILVSKIEEESNE